MFWTVCARAGRDQLDLKSSVNMATHYLEATWLSHPAGIVGAGNAPDCQEPSTTPLIHKKESLAAFAIRSRSHETEESEAGGEANLPSVWQAVSLTCLRTDTRSDKG